VRRASVATQAAQVARLLGAGRILGTSRSKRDGAVLKRLGVDELIDTGVRDFADRVIQVTDGAGADVIVDHVGGHCLPANIHAAAVNGRIIGVGRLGGAEGTLDMEELARKRLEIIGTTFRTRTPEDKAEVVRALCAKVDLNGAADALRPVIDCTFPWTRTPDAQAALESNRHLGKIVLQVG
jgi:NADPH:quinone reductase-like Zn-dependent oxidoreductase